MMTAYNSRNMYIICFLMSVSLHVSAVVADFDIPAPQPEPKESMKVLLNYCIPAPEPAAETPEPEPAIEKPVIKTESAKKKMRQTKKTISQTQEVLKPSAFIPIDPSPTAEEAPVVQPDPEPAPVMKPAPPVKTTPDKPVFDYTGYRSRLGSALESGKHYPYIARRKGIEGLVGVRAVINPDGTLKLATVETSSGHSVLDKEALKLVASVFPFEKGSGEEFNILIPVRYSLEG